ncbi:MAG TPA: phosphatase PAP2 family protein [Pirellulales bacterium]|jgi:membrane-associated phospholipid phosphatase|nr:phosphatase PAP2 family protein [Pirellulales bacterium]
MAELSISRPFSAQLSVIARSVSDLFSPAALSVPCLLLGVLASDEPGTYRYAILYFLVGIPIPVAYVLWLLKSGRVSDFHLPDRRDRTGPFVVAIAGAVCAAILLAIAGAPTVFLAPVITSLLLTLALFLVTLKWQISIHSATTTALVTFAILALGPGAAVLALCIPLVIWARMYLGRHTLAQSLAGGCLGCATFMGLFALRGIVW